MSLPDDYFLDVDDEMLDYLERQGEDCIKEIQQSNATNKENGYKLLSILIVGTGSSFLLLTQKPHLDFLSVGLLFFLLGWSYCAIYLVLGVLKVQMKSAISATPSSIHTKFYKTEIFNEHNISYYRSKGFDVDNDRLSLIRRYGLISLEHTANELLTDNARLRSQLTRARMVTILTPLFAALLSAIALLCWG